MQLEVTRAQELTADLMQTNRDLTGWRHSQINFESVWIFIDLAKCIFAWLTKIATELFLTVTTSDFATGGRQDTNLS